MSMRRSGTLLHLLGTAALACLLACVALNEQAHAADSARSIIAKLQDQFGLNESQVRRALGVLLVFARERLPQGGIRSVGTTHPKCRASDARSEDTRNCYWSSRQSRRVRSLAVECRNGTATGRSICTAVLEYLAAVGYGRERDFWRECWTDCRMGDARSQLALFLKNRRGAAGRDTIR